jgi:hypothetical protein
MNADELDEIVKHLENARYVGASKAAAMLRQLQAENDALRKTVDSLFAGLESSLALNKAQAERQDK